MLRRGDRNQLLSPAGSFGVVAGPVAAWEEAGNVVLQPLE
jgi:hypothetical protein